MAYSAYEVSFSTKNPTIVDLIKANKNIQKPKSECLSLKMVNVEDIICVSLYVFQMHPLQTLKITQIDYVMYLYKKTLKKHDKSEVIVNGNHCF